MKHCTGFNYGLHRVGFAILSILIVSLSCLSNTFAQELKYAGMGSRDASTVQLSASGGSGSEVSLYTGQHSDLFPIASIPTTGMPITVGVNLTYSGNVSQAGRFTNNEVQVSWVGLGFSFGQDAIVADHKGTVDVYDDDYYYTGAAGESYKLVQHSSNSDRFNSPAGFKEGIQFVRSRATFSDVEVVIGWSVHKGDGFMYSFGDFATDTTGRNATSYALRWGHSVIARTYAKDTLYPVRWELSKVENGSENYVSYAYDQELARLHVDNDTATTSAGDSTDNQYTRAIHVSEISSSSGHSITLIHGLRTDVPELGHSTDYQMFGTKRIDSIYVEYGGNRLSRTALEYDFLNVTTTRPEYNKLFLRSIVVLDSSGLNALPSTDFEYYEDTSLTHWGSLKSITYPQGAKKEIVYQEVGTSEIYTQLNYTDTLPAAAGAPINGGYVAHSSNGWIKVFKGPSDTAWRYSLGAWNGYWHTDILDDLTDIKYDSAVATGSGWVVTYNHRLQSFIRFDWSGGRWIRDTIPWAVGTNSEVRIYAGEKFFVGIETHSGISGGYENGAAKGIFVREEGSEWFTHEIFNFSNYSRLAKVQLANDMYAVLLMDTTVHEYGGGTWQNIPYFGELMYGKFDSKLGAISTGTVSSQPWLDFAIGQDFLAWYRKYIGLFGVEIIRYDGSLFSTYTVDGGGTQYDQIDQVIALSSGIAWLKKYHFLSTVGVYLKAHMFQGSSGVTSQLVTGDGYPGSQISELFPSGGDNFASRRFDDSTGKWDIELFDWNGTTFTRTDMVTDVKNFSVNVQLTRNTCAAWINHGNDLWVKRRDNDGNWGTTSKLHENIAYYSLAFSEPPDLGAAKDIVVVDGNDSTTNSIARRFAYTWDDIGSKWDTLDIVPYTDGDGRTTSSLGVYGKRLMHFSVGDNISSFQMNRGKLVGKPRYSVVKSILSLPEGPLTQDTIETEWTFENSILNEGASGLRFHRGAISNPHDIDSSAMSWSISYFYNDLDNDKFTISGGGAPDLDSSYYKFGSTTTEIDRGGYLLDGREYLSIDSSKDETGSEQADTVRTEYEFVLRNASNNHLYSPSPVTVRTSSVINDVNGEINYLEYDSRGRVRKTSIPAGDGFSLVSKTTFAWGGNPLLKESWLQSDTSSRRISVELNQWISPVNRSKSYIYPDAQAGDYHVDTTIVAMDDPYTYMNSDSALTEYQRVESYNFIIDSAFLPTYSFVTADSVWYQPWELQFDLELRTSHDSEYCVIKRNGVTMDSLASYSAFKSPTTIFLCGSFEVALGDQIDIILENSVGRPWGAGGIPNESWCKATANQRFRRVDEFGVPKIQTFSTMDGLPGSGIDAHHNLLSWTSIDMDTSGAKFTQDNGMKLGAISDGFVNNVFLFDAENSDFTSSSFGYDNWENVAGSNGSITNEDQFTGAHSFKVTSNVSAQPGLRRSVLADSLVRSDYILDFWSKSGGDVYAILTGYSGGATCTSILHQSGFGSPTDWEHKQRYFSLDSCSALDSVVVEIGFGPNVQTGDNIAYIDNVRFHPVDAQIATTVYDHTTGQVVSTLGTDNIPTSFEYDSFQRLVRTLDYKGATLSEIQHSYSRDGSPLDRFEPTKPNRVTTLAYDGVDTRKVVAFLDGEGKALQQRSLVSEKGATHTLVTGATKINARGQLIKAYKPFLDLVDETDIDSFSVDIDGEAKNYYNDTNNIDLGIYPFSESEYGVGLRDELKRAAFPGALQSMSSGKTFSYERFSHIESSDTFTVVKKTDPDGIKSASKTSLNGRRSISVQYFDNAGNPDSVLTTTLRDVYGTTSRTKVQFSAMDSVKEVERKHMTDLGRIESSWTFEGGTVSFFYDNAGRVRFSQNQRQDSLGEFTYVKYDRLGRTIEQGTLSDVSKLQESYAVDRSFPLPADLPEVKYRWYFDFHVVNGDTLSQPGNLLRVENHDSSYYKEFYYYPEDDSALTIVKLPISGGSLKAIKYVTMRDGKLKRKEIRPNVNVSSTWRAIEYDYDIAGRISSVNEGAFGSSVKTLQYTTYEYDANGLLTEMLIGADDLASYDAVQRVNYSYDELGRLVAINRPENIPNDMLVGTTGGGYANGIDNDHYAMDLQYYDGTSNTYANGRPSALSVSNSTQSSGVLEHKYNLTYNDRGWLVNAVHDADSAYDREYLYNDMGIRTGVIEGRTNSITYTYDPQTWRFLGFSTTSAANQCKYDKAGNLIADSSRSIFEQRYDYRNQLTYSRVAPSAGSIQDSLKFEYDENEQRISKRHWYQYWGTCGGDPPPQAKVDTPKMILAGWDPNLQSNLILATGPGGGGDPCLKSTLSDKFYLYDAGVLLATFDGSDNIGDVFINGPNGRIANYQGNLDIKLIYYLNDHQGSPRAIMGGSSSPQMLYYAHYYPFGSLLEEWTGGASTPYNYTGKETDDHSTFDFQYYGARYYDSRIGQFTSIDKAGQFFGGYRYGNNPITTIDPDGNLNFGDVFEEGMGLALWAIPGAQGAALMWSFRPVGYAFVDSRGNPFAVAKAAGMVLLGGEISKLGGRFGAIGSGASVVVMNVISGRPLTEGVVSHYAHMGAKAGIQYGVGKYRAWRFTRAKNKVRAAYVVIVHTLVYKDEIVGADPFGNDMMQKIENGVDAMIQATVDGVAEALSIDPMKLIVLAVSLRNGSFPPSISTAPTTGLDYSTLSNQGGMITIQPFGESQGAYEHTKQVVSLTTGISIAAAEFSAGTMSAALTAPGQAALAGVGVRAGRPGVKVSWRGGEIVGTDPTRATEAVRFRINPTGNWKRAQPGTRIPWQSRLPHYHRRGPGKFGGKGSMGTHRPWEGGPWYGNW